MNEAIAAYPLQWPVGWKRTDSFRRRSATFGKTERNYANGSSSARKRDLTVADGVERVIRELERMGVDRQDVVISTNVRTRLDGLPRSGEPKPSDPGAAVYWRERVGQRAPRVMAIDRYDDVADNLAAIALTLEAMRSIERHGGAMILERAFTGFTALANPDKPKPWREVLGFPNGITPTADAIRGQYRTLAAQRHPDRGGSDAAMSELNAARDDALRAIGAA